MISNFYKAFEDKFRGSRDQVKSRLHVYKPFIEPLSKLYPHALALDLGCGRGEWLETIQEMGFMAQGVDLDAHMLQTSIDCGLTVHQADAISFLKELPDQSHAIISAFHLVEHLPFDDLHVIVEEALRVLLPGGILILETPNPENIIVGTSYFYTDPTHNRPLPPQLLAFLVEHHGFKKVKLLRLQEPHSILTNHALSLNDIFYGVSPDYAVVAQKQADFNVLAQMNQAFETTVGVTLEQIISIYTQQQHQHLIATIRQEMKANRWRSKIKRYFKTKLSRKKT